ncbi:MAG: hypothetical protein IPP43_16450 [Chitinophagaceae bacterium]|nr:hypothetical protein [Chitinophagaceae bacterium]
MHRKLILLLAATFSIYSVNAQPGSWRQIGGAGVWANTLYATSCNGALFTIEKSGKLYKTDPATGSWSVLNSASYTNSTMLIGGGKNLFTIETDGSLYRTQPETGNWMMLGKKATGPTPL